MNYEKKRQRQNGRQSYIENIQRKAYFKGQFDLLQSLMEQGCMPKIDADKLMELRNTPEGEQKDV